MIWVMVRPSFEFCCNARGLYGIRAQQHGRCLYCRTLTTHQLTLDHLLALLDFTDYFSG